MKQNSIDKNAPVERSATRNNKMFSFFSINPRKIDRRTVIWSYVQFTWFFSVFAFEDTSGKSFKPCSSTCLAWKTLTENNRPCDTGLQPETKSVLWSADHLVANCMFCFSVGLKYEWKFSLFRKDIQDSVLDALEGKRENCPQAGSSWWHPVLFSPVPYGPVLRRSDPTGHWCVWVLGSTSLLVKKAVRCWTNCAANFYCCPQPGPAVPPCLAHFCLARFVRNLGSPDSSWDMPWMMKNQIR